MFTPTGVLALLMTLGAEPTPALERLDPPAAPGAMASNLVASGPDELLLTWLEPEGGSAGSAGKPQAHQLRFSRWKAGAWSPAVTLAKGEGLVANWADFPSMVRGPKGTLVAHWAERSGKSPYA